MKYRNILKFYKGITEEMKLYKTNANNPEVYDVIYLFCASEVNKFGVNCEVREKTNKMQQLDVYY